MPTWLWDLLGLLGLGLVTIGMGLAWLPFMFIVPGVAILAIAVLGARRHAAYKDPRADGGNAGKSPVQPQ
jgi:hypothetical protein